MYVYVCIYMYMYMYMYIYIYKYMYLYSYVYIYKYINLYTNTYIYIHIYLYIFMCTYMYVYIYIYIRNLPKTTTFSTFVCRSKLPCQIVFRLKLQEQKHYCNLMSGQFTRIVAACFESLPAVSYKRYHMSVWQICDITY